MPTYEYRCSAGHQFEQFQRMSEPPTERCPRCGAPAERLLSGGGGLLFKGSGFYITDYRSDSYRKSAAAETGGTKPAAEKGATDKPAAPSSGGEKSGPEKKAAPQDGGSSATGTSKAE